MKSTAFDRLAKVIGQPASRRAGLQAAIVSLLAFGESSAVTKDRGNGTSHRDRARAEACIPTGKSCPGKKPRDHNKHGKAARFPATSAARSTLRSSTGSRPARVSLMGRPAQPRLSAVSGPVTMVLQPAMHWSRPRPDLRPLTARPVVRT